MDSLFLWTNTEKIYEKLKEERQISASLETIETYIEKVVKPYFDKKRVEKLNFSTLFTIRTLPVQDCIACDT